MIAAALPPDLALTASDSARAVAHVYTVSLAVTAPLLAAAGAAVALRRAPAGTRSLVWRSAVLALLAIYVGRLLPAHWTAWIVPSALASPLVLLGRAQFTGPSGELAATAAAGTTALPSGGYGALVSLVLVIYWGGVAFVILAVARQIVSAHLRGRRAVAVRDAAWLRLLQTTKATLGVRRPVRLLVASDAAVPVTWGLLRPVILLPEHTMAWAPSERRAVLLHELAHVRAADAAFGIAARVMCALYWFHPGAWWVARGLRADCELACDDRVLGAGVRPSAYAALLVKALDALRQAPRTHPGVAMAISGRADLRGRLARVVDTRRDIRAPARVSVALAAIMTLAVAVPSASVQLAPTRQVLTTLMRDTRWETRAYAVVRLAQRPDSVAFARSAAELDPSPSVRAWARYALAQVPLESRNTGAPARDRTNR